MSLLANTGTAGFGPTAGIDTTGAKTLVVAIVNLVSGNAPVGVSDNKGNAFTLVQTRNGSSVRTRLYVNANANPTVGASHTFTGITGGGSTFPAICVAAFSQAINFLDGHSENSATGTSIQPGSVTPGHDNALLIAVNGVDGAGANSVDSAFSITNAVAYGGGANFGLALAYKELTTPAANNPTWSWSPSHPAATMLAALNGGGSPIDQTGQIHVFTSSSLTATPNHNNGFGMGRCGGTTQTPPQSVAVGCTLRNWYIQLGTAPGAGKSRVYTIQKNLVDTGLTIRIADTATSGSITGPFSEVHFAAGDLISFESAEISSPAGTSVKSAYEVVPDTPGQWIYGYATATDTPVFLQPFGGWSNAWGASTAHTTKALMGLSGTITTLCHHERTAPGGGGSFLVALYKNGVKQDGSGGTVDTRATLSGANQTVTATFALPVVAGDTIQFERTTSGAPAGSTWQNGSIVFEPDDPTSYTFYTSSGGMSTAAVEYQRPHHAGTEGWGATETDFTCLGHGTVDLQISGIRAALSAAAGSGTGWTITLRKNGADTGLAVTIMDPATTGFATIDPPITITAGDTWNLQSTPINSPSALSADSIVVLTGAQVGGDGTEVEFENATTEIGIHWVEHTTADDTTHVWSKYYLPDPASYYHGEKLELVTKWNQIRRSLSDRRGQYSGTIYGYELSDTDHSLRTIAADEVTQYLINNPTVIRSIPDVDRRALLTPRTVVRGVVREVQPLSPLLFGVTCEDWLSKRFRVGNNERQIPARLIKDDIPTAPDVSLEKGVPIIYGRLSDQDTAVTEVGTTLPYNAALPAINTAGCRDLATPGATLTGGITCIVCGVKTGAEGPISNPAGTTHYAPHALQFGWDQDTTFDSYNAYFFDAPWLDWTPQGGVRPGATVTFVRKLTHDNSTFDGWSSKDMSVVLEHITDGTDALSGVATVSVDQGKGVIAPIYVGTQTISSTRYHKFVIAGHACKAIDELYVEGLAQNIATDATQAGVGGIWLIPGYAGWTAAFGATVYEVINGHRYTVIYGKTGTRGPDLGAGEMVPDTIGVPVADHIPPLSVNVQGIETVGDGTGTLITKVIDQMYHFAVNYVAQDYAGGDWAAVPTFADDATLPLVNQDSFDAADAVGDTQIAGGIVGAGMFADLITLREAFARFAVSAGVRYGFNRKTQLAAFKLSDDPDLTTAPHYTQELDILKDSFHLRTMQDDWANEIPYAFGRNYATGEWAAETSIADSESIANYGETKVLELQTYWFLRDAAIASDVASRELLWRRIPPNVVTLETPLRGLNDDQGDYIRVTHTSGLGPTGWTEQPTWIVRHEVDPDRNKVWLELEDIARYVGSPQIGGGPFVLGDEGVIAETWLTATDADKAYGYLSDATTGQFTDGALGKELR